MSTHLGKEGVIKVGGTAVGEVVSFVLNQDVELVPDTALGDDFRTLKAGSKSWGGTLTCMYDPSDAAQAALTSGATVALLLYPEGEASGDQQFSGNAIVGPMSVNVSGNDAISEATFAYEGTGALTIDTV